MLLSAAMFSQTNEEIVADSTGLPGDHFSLHGALEMFKQSSSLEDFEKKLNSESNYVNNLDLNNDGKTDYISVHDLMKDNTHAVVLKVAVSKDETQDIAVIELQKDADESATLQIVGDEELYGEKKIVEPYDEKEIPKGKSGGYNMDYSDFTVRPVIVNVWGWPCVRFMFAPLYVPWVSPFYWGVYPRWWSPWYVHPWRWHYMHCYAWGGFYRPTAVVRVAAAGALYGPRRSVSVTVSRQYAPVRAAYRAGTVNGARTQSSNTSRTPAANQNRTPQENKASGNNEQRNESRANTNRNGNNQNKNGQSRQERRANKQNARKANKENRAKGENKGGKRSGGGRRGGGGRR
jgi:hypothetical protein